MSTFNSGTISPLPNFPERGRQEVEVKVATPPRTRSGKMHAEEGLGFQSEYSAPFYASVYYSDSGASHKDVEVQAAGQANGRGLLGSGQAIPAWDAVDGAERSAFVQGQSDQEQSVTATPFMHYPRPGANHQALGPMYGFNAGERPGNTYSVQTAPENGGRGRRNAADVTDVG